MVQVSNNGDMQSLNMTDSEYINLGPVNPRANIKLANEYSLSEALNLLKQGFHVRLDTNTSHTNSFLEEYKNQIYGCYINSKERLKTLYPSITHVYFNCDFNEFIGFYDIPETVKSISFGLAFNQNVDYLPESLDEITFGTDFNQPIDHLPTNIKIIRFKPYGKFNQFIGNLPAELEELYLGYSFNKPVDNLPNKLKKLTFGSDFNKSIDNIPNTIEFLGLGTGFQQQVEKLPMNLNKIVYKYCYKFVLPVKSNLEIVRF